MLRNRLDHHQTFAVKAKEFGRKLRAIHKYQALGKKWESFELKYFVISDLSAEFLGGSDAMKEAATRLLAETAEAMRQDREDHEMLRRLAVPQDATIPEVLQFEDELKRLLEVL